MRRLTAFAVVLGLVTLASGATGHASAQLWKFGAGKPKFKTLQSAALPYTVQYPDKDWNPVSVTGDSVILAHSRGEAAVVIDRQSLTGALTAEEIGDPALTKSETARVHKAHPRADGFRTRVEAVAGRPILILDFNKPGAQEKEQVRQYSIPIDLYMYRIVCSAKLHLFPGYEAVFQHMAATITPKPAAKTGSESTVGSK